MFFLRVLPMLARLEQVGQFHIYSYNRKILWLVSEIAQWPPNQYGFLFIYYCLLYNFTAYMP